MHNIVIFLGFIVQFPIIIRCDNVGAIYLAKNNESRCTKHIDMHIHFVREYVVNGIILIIFIRTKETRADPFTKNVSAPIFDKQYDYMSPISIVKT